MNEVNIGRISFNNNYFRLNKITSPVRNVLCIKTNKPSPRYILVADVYQGEIVRVPIATSNYIGDLRSVKREFSREKMKVVFNKKHIQWGKINEELGVEKDVYL